MDEGLICGIDEAGRGSLIGPLVVAGFAAPLSVAKTLRGIGVRDSKKLTRKRRYEVYQRLMDLPSIVEVVVLDPLLVDSSTKARGRGGINKLEAAAIREIIKRIDAGRVYVDSLSRDAASFGLLLRSEMGGGVEVICGVRADSRYPIVGAASIIAKVERDRWVEDLKERLGDIGSGYPADEKTREFVRDWLIRKGSLPGFVRASWRTIEKLYPRLEDYE